MRLGLGHSLRASTLLGTEVPYEPDYNVTVITSANGSITPYNITSIPDNWQYNNGSTAVSVFIGDIVNTIGELAFSGVSGITSITSTANSALTSIGAYAFENTSITSFIIRNSVTSIGNSAFNGCDDLTNVTIPNSVTSIGTYAFYSCDNLTNMTIPNSVTNMGSGAFYGCSGLTSVSIGNGVTSIGGSAFSGCTVLTSVTIGNSVTTIGDYAFQVCSNLPSLTIPISVTSIGSYAFYQCNDLINLNCYAARTSFNIAYGCLAGTGSPFIIHARSGDTSWSAGGDTIGGFAVTVIKDLA
jgi:hypothetical protein